MSGVQLLALSRFAFAVAQIAAVVYFGFLYYHRTDGSPRAASTMDANHVLTAQDLDFLESKEFLGKVLKVHVEAGSRISRDQVAPRPPAIAPVRPGTVAAVVVASEKTLQLRRLGMGSDVSVRRTNQRDLPGRIFAMTCDKERCTVVVVLDAMPADALDLNSFVVADLEARVK